MSTSGLVQATPENADAPERLRLLIASERYVQAESGAKELIGDAPKDRAAQVRRLAGLVVLINSRLDEQTLSSAEDAELLDEAQTLASDIYGEKARRSAFIVAAKASFLKKRGSKAVARGLLNTAQKLLIDGSGTIDPASHAIVVMIASEFDDDDGHWKGAADLLAAEDAVLHNFHDNWSQRVLARLLCDASLYESQAGNDNLSLKMSQRSASIAELLAGHNSLLRARALNEQAQTLYYKGEYGKARDVAREAVRILRSLEKRSSDLASALTSLGSAESHLGNFDVAGTLFEEAITLEGTITVDLEKRNKTIASYAVNEHRAERLEHALKLYHEALSGKEQLFGADNPAILNELMNLSYLEMDMKRPVDALVLQRRAMAMADAAFGSDSPQSRKVKVLAAETELSMGHAPEAIKLYEETIHAQLIEGGPTHTDMYINYCNLGLAYARVGDDVRARTVAKQADGARLELLEDLLPAMSESDGKQLKTNIPTCIGLRLGLAARESTSDPVETLALWSDVARARNLVSRLQALRLASLRTATTDRQRKLWNAWEAAAKRYADAVQANAEPKLQMRERKALEQTEETLSSELPNLGIKTSHTAFTKQWLEALTKSASVVAYVRAPSYDLTAAGHETLNDSDHMQEMYFALVGEVNGNVRVVQLGAAADVEAALSEWQNDLVDPLSDPSHLARTGSQVRALIWDRLGLPKTQHQVYWIPDSQITRINPAALPTEGQYLVETGVNFRMLDSEIELVQPARPVSKNKIVLIAPFVADAAHPINGFGQDCQVALDEAVRGLPGATRELDSIQAIAAQRTDLTAVRLNGERATEAGIKRQLPAGILHFATHGLVLNEHCAKTSNTSRGMSFTLAQNPENSNVKPNDSAEPALLIAAQATPTSPTLQAELLTAARIVTWHLDNVDWVVLSACNSSFGTMVADEGTLGLRHAFHLAGARSVVMSLWNIDDAATAEWMENLYRARLIDHVGTADAIAAAEVSTLKERGRRGESTHPYYWAGFISSGDWR